MSVPRIPVIFVAGRNDLGIPKDVCEQIRTVTPASVAVTKSVATLTQFCEESVVPDLVIVTNLENTGIDTPTVIKRLRELGIQVAVMVSTLTESAIRSMGVHIIRKPARLGPLIECVIRALPARA